MVEVVIDALDATGTPVQEFVTTLGEPSTAPRATRSQEPTWLAYRRGAQPGRYERSTCPNPQCLGPAALPPGTPLLTALRTEQRCRACGTRFLGDAIAFSFDDISGYSRACSQRNRARLDQLRAAVMVACADALAADRPVLRKAMLRQAGLHSYSPAWTSPRAGLVSIVDAHRRRQPEARLAQLPAPSHPEIAADPHLQAALELFRNAVIVGPKRATRAIGLSTPYYYRWQRRLTSGGVQTLRLMVNARRSPFRHRPNCRCCREATTGRGSRPERHGR